MVTNVYVDGSNLYYACLKGTPHRWLDLGALCRRLLPEHEIKRIRLFTARLKPPHTWAMAKQDAYLAALGSVPGLTIHLGELVVIPATMRRFTERPTNPPRTATVIRTREKGSDVRLASYLLLDAFRDDCELSVVVSNDSDLVEPVRMVTQELRRPLGLIEPKNQRRVRSDALVRVGRPAFVKSVTPADLAASQLPEELTVGRRKLHRPSDWRK